MKDAMTTTLHRTDERLAAEQRALCDALKALVRATKRSTTMAIG